MLPRDCSCDILVKNVFVFCPRLKSLPDTKVKSFRLIPLTEEISKQPSTDSVLWLLVVTLMKIYNEKEQGNVQFEGKRNTRKWNGAKSCAQGHKQSKKRYKGSGDLRARSHPAEFPTCEMN